MGDISLTYYTWDLDCFNPDRNCTQDRVQYLLSNGDIHALVLRKSLLLGKFHNLRPVRGGQGFFPLRQGGPRIFFTLGQGGPRIFFMPGQGGPTFFLQYIFLKGA